MTCSQSSNQASSSLAILNFGSPARQRADTASKAAKIGHLKRSCQAPIFSKNLFMLETFITNFCPLMYDNTVTKSGNDVIIVITLLSVNRFW